jgi:hypothetical protein
MNKIYIITVQDSIGSHHEISAFDNDVQALEFEALCSEQYSEEVRDDGWSISYNECVLNTPNENLRVKQFT